jgi:hypothetical protein
MRYLAVFRVERSGRPTRNEDYFIEGDYNPLNPDDVELIEDNTPMIDEQEIVFAELVGLHGLND